MILLVLHYQFSLPPSLPLPLNHSLPNARIHIHKHKHTQTHTQTHALSFDIFCNVDKMPRLFCEKDVVSQLAHVAGQLIALCFSLPPSQPLPFLLFFYFCRLFSCERTPDNETQIHPNALALLYFTLLYFTLLYFTLLSLKGIRGGTRLQTLRHPRPDGP